MIVAEFIANFFVEKEIKHIFGFQGGAILKILDYMISSGKIEYIQNYHEQASSFCADAYARITGKIGAAIATSGPGATNLINGIVNAQFDSVPCIFITGQDYTQNIKKPKGVRLNGFQDLDIVQMVKPVTKYAATIYDPKKIKYELQKAYHLAISGRPGSVLLDIPIDIQFAEIQENELEVFDKFSEFQNELSKIDEFFKLLQSSSRPTILIGGGIRTAKATKELKEFAELSQIPVVTTLNGIDCLEGAFSFSGLHGNTFANLALYNSDLILVLGSRLGQRQVGKKREKYAKNAKFIHVDIDRIELNRAVKEDLSIVADVKVFLSEVNKIIKKEKVFIPDFSSWFQQISDWKEKHSGNTHLNKKSLDPVVFLKKLFPSFEENAIFVSDVGHNQMWVAQAVQIKGEQRLLNSTGFGSMGYALPASIGAKFAKPNSQVVCFTGDGGLQMNMQELLLISQKRLDIKCIVFNNNTLGMMREVQERYFNSHFFGSNSKDFICVDLLKLAATYDLGYLKISEEKDIEKMKDVLQQKDPYIIDLRLSKDSLLLNRYDESDVFERNTL
ncbi:MAG: thiamine pyrophosphate-binding protein [Candidatus Caenarcaniphilales bacterium]|nr:thiamine pyrophosphate-binding protein [Candidatus Caenarcaniphilales bacterium]